MGFALLIIPDVHFTTIDLKFIQLNEEKKKTLQQFCFMIRARIV